MNLPRVWFWLRKQGKNTVIYFRIYLNGTDTNNGHSTKIKVQESEWLQEKQQVSLSNNKAKIYNRLISEIDSNLCKFWQSLDIDRQNLTASDFYNAYLENMNPKKVHTVLDVWSEWLEVVKKRVIAKKVNESSFVAWQTAKNNFQKFLVYDKCENLKIKEANFYLFIFLTN